MAKQKFHDTRRSIDIKKEIKQIKIGIQDNIFVFTGPLSINDFAKQLNKPSAEIIKYFFMKGKMYSLNHLLTEEEMGEVCLEYNYDFEKKIQLDETNILEHLNVQDSASDQVKRPPIVTIMGHVDHGKTTLLDTIRKSHIVASEFGGITQHIGAYQINRSNNPITFIDTPGHEAFTKLRARGASITDIVVLVVAANDGIKPQTEEAIDHAKAAKVPIIVFINKTDLPDINIDKIMNQLSEKGLVNEEWGGDTIFVQGSALKNQGIDKLLDAIIAVSDMLELKANPNRDGYGVVLEANMNKGLGPIATLIVQNGTIVKGDFIVAGEAYGRARVIFNDCGKELIKATPGQPIKIIGLSEPPQAGNKWLVMKDEELAKNIAKKIKDKQINFLRTQAITKQINSSDKDKNLNVIIKCDVQGSLEAIKAMLENITVKGAKVNLIRSALGAITESDIQLAKASKAIIIGFNVKPIKNIKDLAQEQAIQIYFYNIIYKLKEAIEDMLYGTLEPIVVEEDIGEAEVKQIWKHSTIGTICGVSITSGKILRNAKARIIRDGSVIYVNTIASMQHGKEIVNEMSAGKECGIVINNFNDIKIGDIIQIFKETNKQAKDVLDATKQ